MKKKMVVSLGLLDFNVVELYQPCLTDQRYVY